MRSPALPPLSNRGGLRATPAVASPGGSSGPVGQGAFIALGDDEVDLLIEIGYLAMSRGMLADALAMMDGLARLRPDKPHPRNGRAIVHHVRGDTDQAIQELQQVIVDFPQAAFARALLATFLKAAGRPGAREMALEALARVPDGPVRDLCDPVLTDGPAAGSTGLTALTGSPGSGAAASAGQGPDQGSGLVPDSAAGAPRPESGLPPGFRGTFV